MVRQKPNWISRKNRSLRMVERKKITAVLVFMQMTSFLVATNHLFCYSGLLLPIENRQQRDEHSRYEVNAVVVVIVIAQTVTQQQRQKINYCTHNIASSSELFCVKNGKKELALGVISSSLPC